MEQILPIATNSYKQEVNFLLDKWNQLHPKIIDLNLCRIQRLLNDLDNPQNKFPPTIHIAGTNGKGSVTTFIKSIGIHAGYKIHAFISPHLIHFNERIVINNQIICNKMLIDTINEVESVNKGKEITFFEMTTAVAFLAYYKNPADLIVIETGLGGEFDATNCLTNPFITLFTSIDIDHKNLLGNSIEKITKTKMGIIRPGVKVVSSFQKPKVEKLLIEHTEKIDSPLLLGGRDWNTNLHTNTKHSKSSSSPINTLEIPKLKFSIDLPKPNLNGDFQYMNSATAVVAIKSLPISFSRESIIKGVKNAFIPARLQKVDDNCIPSTWNIWCDGGHNYPAAKEIAKWLKNQKTKYKWLAYSSLEGKEWQKSLNIILPQIDYCWFLPIHPSFEARTRNEVNHKELINFANQVKVPSKSCSSLIDWQNDYRIKVSEFSLSSGIILIFGSLHLAGSALKYLFQHNYK